MGKIIPWLIVGFIAFVLFTRWGDSPAVKQAKHDLDSLQVVVATQRGDSLARVAQHREDSTKLAAFGRRRVIAQRDGARAHAQAKLLADSIRSIAPQVSQIVDSLEVSHAQEVAFLKDQLRAADSVTALLQRTVTRQGALITQVTNQRDEALRIATALKSGHSGASLLQKATYAVVGYLAGRVIK